MGIKPNNKKGISKTIMYCHINNLFLQWQYGVSFFHKIPNLTPLTPSLLNIAANDQCMSSCSNTPSNTNKDAEKGGLGNITIDSFPQKTTNKAVNAIIEIIKQTIALIFTVIKLIFTIFSCMLFVNNL